MINMKESVIIYFKYGLESDDPYYNTIDKLRFCIDHKNLGLYDGHEIAMDNSDGSFYMYSHDAIHLFNEIKDILTGTAFLKSAHVVITANDKKERFIL